MTIGTRVARYLGVEVATHEKSDLQRKVRPVRRLSLIIVLSLIVGTSGLVAQYDPHGSLDSVVVSDILIAPTGSFTLAVRLVNDEEVRAFSIPLNYNKHAIVLDSVSFLNSRAINWSFLRATHDPDAGTILVGGLSMDDPFVPVGAGTIASLYFHPVEGLSAGQTAAVDSAFIPPAGEFIVTAFDNASIRPAFRPGGVIVSAEDLPPVFAPVSRRIVNEGDTLELALEAGDPEGAVVTLAAENLPPGAVLIDNGGGKGVFRFPVPYVGPGSASGSPLQVKFSATAGSSSGYLKVPIEIVNVNRPPSFVGNQSLSGAAGDTVYLPVLATDPDYERVTLYCNNLPAGAQLSQFSPGYLSWPSGIADSGSHGLTITATDESGGTCSQQMQIYLSPTVPIDLGISEEQAFSGEAVEVLISMHNRVDVSYCRFLVKFDETMLDFDEVVRSGTRIEDWQILQTTYSPSEGLLWITAEADSNSLAAASLTPGDGAIARLLFRTTSDLGFAGYHSRINFEFIDGDSLAENYLYAPDGTFIGSSQINYASGGVLIKAYDALVGDINLNGIPFEVGDLVYFSNFFIDPFHYPLDGVRWPNSDINQDGLPGTLADLIYMQSIMDGENPKLSAQDSDIEASYYASSDEQGYVYSLSSEGELSGARYTFVVDDVNDLQILPSAALAGVDIRVGQQADTLRLLLLGSSQRTFSAAGEEMFRIVGASKIELVEQEYVDTRSRPIPLFRSAVDVNLPKDYSLEQNYPNPFNPQTTILFSLPAAGNVSLKVYNVLGERVKTLVDGYLPAGRHELVFNGKDGDGRDLASGIYFYRLRSAEFESSRKMLLLK